MSASKLAFGVRFGAVVVLQLVGIGPVSYAQLPPVERLPTSLPEALERLNNLNMGPTQTRQLGPAEIVGEIPDHSLVTLRSCQAAAEYSARTDGRALVVMIDGKLAYERYEAAWPHWKDHRLTNASECFAGVVAAMGVQDGLLEFDEPVAKTISEWADDSNLSKVTIRQLLNLTSGIEPGEPGVVPTYKQAVQAKSISEPGMSFEYGPNSLQVFGELICRKLAEKHGKYDRMGFVNYLNERVLQPLKIEIGFWRQSLDEEADVPLGASLNGRDWAKFGELLCSSGSWDGKELIRPELVAELLKGSEANQNYGMGLWLISEESEPVLSQEARAIMPTIGRTHVEGMYVAAGSGRQRLYVLPRERIVIVRFGDPKGGLFRDEPFLRSLIVK